MKKVRSLKIRIPPAAELARARDQILNKLNSAAPADRFRIVPRSEAERQRDEGIVDQITRRLRAHRRSEQSEIMVHNQVLIACLSVEAEKHSTKPAVIEEITTKLVDAARELHSVLGKADLPPNYVFGVFRNVENWNRFVEHLEKLTTLTYRKPPRNIDRVKRECAVVAWQLITTCTVKNPTGSQGGLFRSVAGLLHQFVCPTADGEIVDLKSPCDDVLKRVRAGSNLETERWY